MGPSISAGLTDPPHERSHDRLPCQWAARRSLPSAGTPTARRSQITITITISYPQSTTRLLIHQRIEYEAGQSSTPRALEKTVHRLPSTVHRRSGRLADLCRRRAFPQLDDPAAQSTIPNQATRLPIHQRIEYEAGQSSTRRALEKTVHRLPSAVPVGDSPISAKHRAFPQLDDPKSQLTIPNQATRLLIHQRIEYKAGQSSTPRALEKNVHRQPSTIHRLPSTVNRFFAMSPLCPPSFLASGPR